MKVVLLNPPSKQEGAVIRDNLFGCFTKAKAEYVWPPMHLAQLAACLEPLGIECRIVDSIGEKLNYSSCAKKLKGADYIVLVTATAAIVSDIDFVNYAKKRNKNLKSVFIGNHVTLFPEQTLKSKAVDYIILGEPEETIVELFDAFLNDNDLARIKGIGYKKGSKKIVTGKSPTIQDLDSLPTPRRELIPDAEYFNPLTKRTPYTTIMSSRGCHYPCIFCAAGLTYGKKYRARTPKSLIKEIKLIREQGYKEIFFRDEEFTMDQKRVAELCRLIKKEGIDITWICNSHANTLNLPLLKLMKEAGCHMVKIGVESGSDKILKNIKKMTTTAHIRKVFKWINELKLESVAHFMIGNPGETEETIKQTIKFSKELNPTYISFNIATPYPGTPLYEKIKDKVKDFSKHDMHKGLVTAQFTKYLCDLEPEIIEKYFRQAHRSFYFRPSYIIKRLLRQNSFPEFLRSAKAGLALLKK